MCQFATTASPSIPRHLPLVSTIPCRRAHSNTMHASKREFPMTNRPRTVRGFTLIEMLIVVVLVGILAAIALPSYFQYVQRSKIIEATTGLSNYRTKMEQYFLDNRTYVGGCVKFHDAVQAQVKAFTIADCTPSEQVSAYTITATGNPADAMDGSFVYTINEQDVKTTAGPYGSSASCWITRKDGTCG